MIKAILFDLDGTLLPMDQDLFVKAYLGGLAKHMAPHGYDPQKIVQALWEGTGAMVQNDGSSSNETLLWSVFCKYFGDHARKYEPLFIHFYENEFQDIRHVCGFDVRAAETLAQIKEMGYRLILATNPLFPAIATHSRVRWAGLATDDFELITTYENSCHCKPNQQYYLDILDSQGLKPEECLMVGNDVTEDMVARTLGMKVFLLTDHLINKENRNIDEFPNGSFPELMDFIRRL